MGGWDRGVEYEAMLKRLKEIRAYVKGTEKPSPRLRRLLRNANILLVQLANGLRRSEAVDCYYQFLQTGDREQVVRVRKSKGRLRPCRVPDMIDHKDVKLTKDLPPPKPGNLTVFALRKLGTNTHSLRYAFINRMLKKGADIATISKLIGHTKLDTLVTYVQEKRAKELLEEAVKELRE